MTRPRWVAGALLGAAFLVGGLAGAGATMLARRDCGPRIGSRPPGPEGFVRHLAGRLDLTSAQQDSVRAILARHQPEMDSLWREVGPKFDTFQAQVRTEIRGQLTQDQQREFTEMMQRFDAKRSRPRPAVAPR